MENKISRTLDIFNKSNKKLADQIDVTFIDLEVWKLVFKFYEDDPLMYMVYTITETEAEILKPYLDIVFNFDDFIYQVSC